MRSGTAPVALADVQETLRTRLGEVRRELRRIVEADFKLIAMANAHLMEMQGKMFRPTLVLLANEASGHRQPRAVTLAAVVELIHLATLVHDDSVDHSVLRRGMPTLNALFSHQVSVIMGDYLYSRAVIELVRLEDLEPLRVLARVTNEMTIGEMRQLSAHDPLGFTEDDYYLLIRAKTASLLSGACEVGAIGGDARYREALRIFGENLGMAFQIIDDLIDYTEEEATTGKPSGSDLREHKVTLPLIYALPRLSPPDREIIDELMATPEPSDPLISDVIAKVTESGGLAYARDRAQHYCDRAERQLDALPRSAAREALRLSLAYLLERRS